MLVGRPSDEKRWSHARASVGETVLAWPERWMSCARIFTAYPGRGSRGNVRIRRAGGLRHARAPNRRWAGRRATRHRHPHPRWGTPSAGPEAYAAGDARHRARMARSADRNRPGCSFPEPIALDADGSWFGTAALVMSRLPVAARSCASDTNGFLVQTAAALARIHRASAGPGLDVTIGPRPAHIWASPSPPPRNSLLRRAHQTVASLCDIDAEPVLIHGDFFSGNLVWSRGQLTGVVDWRSIGRGPREWDLANSRTDLVILSGWRTADRLLRLYEIEGGTRPGVARLGSVLRSHRHRALPRLARRLSRTGTRRLEPSPDPLTSAGLRRPRSRGCTVSARQDTACNVMH